MRIVHRKMRNRQRARGSGRAPLIGRSRRSIRLLREVAPDDFHANVMPKLDRVLHKYLQYVQAAKIDFKRATLVLRVKNSFK
jgi:hypothetical protein